jgi:hypothetical protein
MINKMDKEIRRKLKVISIKAQTFYEALKQQDVKVLHVNWKHPQLVAMLS